jgi:hypothetical protein
MIRTCNHTNTDTHKPACYCEITVPLYLKHPQQWRERVNQWLADRGYDPKHSYVFAYQLQKDDQAVLFKSWKKGPDGKLLVKSGELEVVEHLHFTCPPPPCPDQHLTAEYYVNRLIKTVKIKGTT